MQDGFCHITLLYVGSCVLALVCAHSMQAKGVLPREQP